MNFSYTLAWYFFRTVFTLGFRLRVYDPQRLPATGPVVLAANHGSFMDPPLIGAALGRQVNFLARDNLFRNPLMAALLRSWQVVPVDREGAGAAGLKAILDRLRAGRVILLFPEGTRTHDGSLQPARSGIGLTVVKSDCPVVPIRLFGTFEAYGRHQRLPRPRQVQVKVGMPHDYAAQRTEARTCSKPRLKAIYQEIADDLMARIGRLEPCRDVTRFPE